MPNSFPAMLATGIFGGRLGRSLRLVLDPPQLLGGSLGRLSVSLGLCPTWRMDEISIDLVFVAERVESGKWGGWWMGGPLVRELVCVWRGHKSTHSSSTASAYAQYALLVGYWGGVGPHGVAVLG